MSLNGEVFTPALWNKIVTRVWALRSLYFIKDQSRTVKVDVADSGSKSLGSPVTEYPITYSDAKQYIARQHE